MSDGGELAAGKLVLDWPAAQVARLTIDNPSRHNALDEDVMDGFVEALDGLQARCLIVTGARGTFSAGYDLSAAAAGDMVAAERLIAAPFAAAIDALETFPQATVAALAGNVLGGGLELALACDLRVAGGAAQLGIPASQLGLIYGHTGVRRVLDAVGAPRARELLLLGRVVDAPMALDWGLVNEVVDDPRLQEAALELAAALARNAPLALAGNKRVIAELVRARGALHPERERDLVELRARSFRSRELFDGVRAFVEKRRSRRRSS